MLDKQISIYSVDTGNFYSNHEIRLHLLNHKLRNERKQLLDKLSKTIVELKEYGIDDKDLKDIYNQEYDFSNCSDDIDAIVLLSEKYCELKNIIKMKNRKIKLSKNKILELLKNKVDANILSDGSHHIRKLNENMVSKKNIISVFESNLTRVIGAKQDELTEDFMVVQVYYFDIIKDLINFGFMYKGEKYIYLTSSAGQIRTKKTVFIKESVWNKHSKTIMCGLSINLINSKGGCNPN